MADLGNLKSYLDDYDIAFEWGRKKYKIKPTAKQILDFKRQWNEVSETKKKSDQATIWEHTAPLFGSSFDRETYEFGPDSNPDGEHHNLLPQLLEDGMDIELLDRLLAAAHAKYFFGDEVAEELAKTGDLGKALRAVRERNEENDKKATPTGAGETSADA